MKRTSNIISLIIKLMLLVALIVVGILIYSTCAGGNVVQRIDKTLPDAIEAPYMIRTATAIYLAKQAEQTGKSVTMRGWYVKEKDKWIFHSEEISLPGYLLPVVSKRTP